MKPCKHKYFTNEDGLRECKKCGLLRTTIIDTLERIKDMNQKSYGAIRPEEPYVTKRAIDDYYIYYKIPPHYKDFSISPIDFIIANKLGFCEGNIIKYACRYNKKGTPIEDLDKIIHYAELLKNNLKK
jgi:hypothetical protein